MRFSAIIWHRHIGRRAHHVAVDRHVLGSGKVIDDAILATEAFEVIG
jgi:hypothetical protein